MQPPDEATRRRRHRNERIAAVAGIALIAIALLVFSRWNAREEEKFKRDRTYIPKPVAMTPEIAMLQEYVRIDTSNPPGSTRAGARWLLNVLAKAGVQAELIEPVPGHVSVYARIRGARTGEGLLLLSHIDVVPADRKAWQSAPFGAAIDLGTMHGRGTLDMKGIAVCQLAAFLDVARSGKRPERDIAFLATADEETGSANGMAWLVAHRPDLFDGIRYSIGEGGITEMVAEKPTYFSIEIGTKQYARLLLESESEEALRRARFALEPYTGAREPERILPEVRRYFQFVAPTRVSYGRELADIDGAVARGKFWILPVAYRNLTQTIVGMEWPRREQQRWRANVHILMLPDDEPAARVEWARRLVAPFGVQVTPEVLEPRTPLSSDMTPMFRLIAGEAEREYHAPAGTLILHRSSNDSRFLRRRGIDCYGVSPYLVDAFQSATIHGVDEQVALDRFVRGVALMRRIVAAWASGS